ncbi:hypothetical protein [Halobellus sp. EA9]|uniref:hypothetical protein n=1 Tax=Halobellus sp. EA9 TaxID=3421647 RepID=UPI003EC02C06
MNRTAVAVGTAEVLGAVALAITTFTIPAFADMALAWRVLAVFIAVEGGKRLSNEVNR